VVVLAKSRDCQLIIRWIHLLRIGTDSMHAWKHVRHMRNLTHTCMFPKGKLMKRFTWSPLGKSLGCAEAKGALISLPPFKTVFRFCSVRSVLRSMEYDPLRASVNAQPFDASAVLS
jgi:hypothetical protein